MATYKGDSGIMKVGQVTVGELTSWTVDQTADIIEDTSMGDVSKTFLSGQVTWTGSCEVILSDSDTGQLLLDNGSDLTGVDFFFDATTSAYTGNAIVTGVSASASIGEMIKASITFQGTGDLTNDPWS